MDAASWRYAAVETNNHLASYCGLGRTEHKSGPTLYESGLSSTRWLELISAKPLLNGAVAMHYRRAH